MDIDLLSKMIKELILDNDEVTLPGVGTFVAEIVPSTFSDKGYTINPPYRKLSFRQRQSNDTLLKDFYIASNNVARESAEKILEDFFDEMDEVLRQKKVIIFPGLGRLRATKENNFFFVADEDLNIYPEGYGLEPVSLKTHQETPEEVGATLDSLKDILSVPQKLEDEPKVEDPVVPSSQPEVVVVVPPQSVVEESIPVASAQESETMPEVPVVEPVVAPVAETPAIEEQSIEETAPVEPDLVETTESEVIVEPSSVVSEPIESVGLPEDEVEATVEPVVSSPVGEKSTVQPKAETAQEKVPEETIHAPAVEVASEVEGVKESIEEPAKEEVKEETKEIKKKSPLKIIFYVLLGVVIVAALALLLFVFLAHIAPDFIDSILYTEEELKIINY